MKGRTMDVARTPYDLKKYDIIGFWRTGMWQSLAHKLPRRLALFAYIRVMGEAWVATNKTPNEITYEEAYKIWEGEQP